MPTGIHWPDPDEDLSVEGMIEGGPAAPRPRQDVSSRRPVARSFYPILGASKDRCAKD